MFEGFSRQMINVNGIKVDTAIAGTGPAVLLLHGYPQCMEQWFNVAGLLVQDFTVVTADLRGYGQSDKPVNTGETYSFRTMAADNFAVMDHFGIERFAVAGHDRGGRVAHRMALDQPDRIVAMMPCDVVPTRAMYTNVDRERAARYWQWYFLPLAAPFPERLIANDPDFYFEHCLVENGGIALSEGFGEKQLAAYRRAWRDPEMIRATCDDYRAGATIDMKHDEADLEARVKAPTFPIWGADGLLQEIFDIEAEWAKRCETVEGLTVPGGHFFPDQQPEATANHIRYAMSRVQAQVA